MPPQGGIKSGHACLVFGILLSAGNEHADAPHSRGLLRARRERPRDRRAAEQRDELAPLSFDHLVGTGEKHWRDFETKFLGGVEINQKREPLRLLHRKITGFCTF